MAEETLARRSRSIKVTRSFIHQIVASPPAAALWTDVASPLRVRSTQHGAQYVVVKKVGGKVWTITPRGADGRRIQDTACLWTLEEARSWVHGVVADLIEGRDPNRSPEAVPTFRELAEGHPERYTRTAAPASVLVRRYGLRHTVPILGDMPVDQIDIRTAMALKGAELSPANAHKAWSLAIATLNLAQERCLVTSNPFRTVRGPKRPQSRDRFPGLTELARIEEACLGDDSTAAEITQFLLRLPLRRQAAETLTWGEVDLDKGELRLSPGAGRKFKAGQTIPLPAMAIELLRERHSPEAAPSDLVFAVRCWAQGTRLSELLHTCADRLRCRRVVGSRFPALDGLDCRRASPPTSARAPWIGS
jgi:integrase